MTAGPALEMWSKQTGSVDSPDGRSSTHTYERGYTITLAASDQLDECYTAYGLPLIGDLYPRSNFIYVTGHRPQRVSPIMAIIIVEYRGEIPAGSYPTTGGGGPEDIVSRITWRNVSRDEPLDEDFNGKAITNKNDEPIEGLTEIKSDQMATIERKFLTINMYAIRLYFRAVNSDAFLGWPPGTARIMDYQATANFAGGFVSFWDISASILFREQGRASTDAKAWYKRVLHQGFSERLAAGGAIEPARNPVTKELETKPVLLDVNGVREPDPESAHWLEFQTLGSLPYSLLGLV